MDSALRPVRSSTSLKPPKPPPRMKETFLILLSSVTEWPQFAKAAGVFAATFVLEDLAAVGAGLLVAAGEISSAAAFVACFLGIWMGDAGLYVLARYAGRRWFAR